VGFVGISCFHGINYLFFLRDGDVRGLCDALYIDFVGIQSTRKFNRCGVKSTQYWAENASKITAHNLQIRTIEFKKKIEVMSPLF
jgi:hypothetical protein